MAAGDAAVTITRTTDSVSTRGIIIAVNATAQISHAAIVTPMRNDSTRPSSASAITAPVVKGTMIHRSRSGAKRRSDMVRGCSHTYRELS